MTQETIHIAVCADHNFIMPVGVLMHSICVNNPSRSIRFFLITDESYTADDERRLQTVLTNHLHTLNVSKVDANHIRETMNFKDGFYKVQTFYRLFLTDLLPSDIDKVIYLDGDIIVRGDLKEFWDTDISDVAIAGCADAQEGKMGNFNRLGYPSALGYFNAGVLLINLKYWRENNVIDEFKRMVVEHPEKIVLNDQDILNYTFVNNKKRLSFKYNLQADVLYSLKHLNLDYWKYHEDLDAAKEKPVILHYSGSRPWEEGCNHPYKDEFFRYRNNTIWKDDPLWKNRTPWLLRNISKLRKPLRRFGVGVIEDPFDRSLTLKE